MTIALVWFAVLIVSVIAALLVGPLLWPRASEREEENVQQARGGFGWPKL